MQRFVEAGAQRLNRQSKESTGLHRIAGEFPVEVSFITYEEKGRILFAAFMCDISERKNAAAELHFKTTLLKTQSEAAFDGIMTVSPSGKILSWNWRFAEMWGLPMKVLALKDDRTAMAAVLGQLTDPDGFLRRVEHLYLHPELSGFDEIALRDGRVFDRYATPVLDLAGECHGRVWFFHDISERRAAAIRESRAPRPLRRAPARARRRPRGVSFRGRAGREDLRFSRAAGGHARRGAHQCAGRSRNAPAPYRAHPPDRRHAAKLRDHARFDRGAADRGGDRRHFANELGQSGASSVARRAMGGALRVESAGRGCGAAFTLELPCPGMPA